MRERHFCMPMGLVDVMRARYSSLDRLETKVLLIRGQLGALAPRSEGNGVNRPLKVRMCRRLILHVRANCPLSSDCCGLQVTAALEGRAPCLGFITVTLRGTAVSGRSRSQLTWEVEQRMCKKKVGWRDENVWIKMKKQLVPAVDSHILALCPALHLIYTHTIYYSSIGHNAFPALFPKAITTECLTLPLALNLTLNLT